MSEKTAQSLMSQWATLLAETNRLILAKDNRIRDLNDKLKEQENKWFLSEKSKCENVAELKRVRAILKNVEKKLVPETTLKNGKASEQPPLKRHLEDNLNAGPSQKFKCLNPVNEVPRQSGSKDLKQFGSPPTNNAQKIEMP